MKKRLTKQERNWVLYDVGNSAFMLLVSTMIPIYFNYLAGNAGLSDVEYMAYWGYAASIATLFVAIIGPVFGTFSDTKGYKKPLFMITIFIGAIGCLALGLDSTGLLLELLVTQFVAFPFAILFGRLAQKFSTDKLIMVCIVAYLGIAAFAMFLTTQTQFWILAVFVGMFQGGIQALSRSYFTKIIPAEQSGEYFGLLDICGKGASFMGTTVVSVVSQLTGNVNMGVGMISIFFVIGIILFHATVKQDSKSEKAEEIEEVLKAC